MTREFPRRKISYPVSRRQFFPALLRELFVLAANTQGRPSYELADLGELPDEELARLIPVVNPAFEITVEDGWLGSRERQSGRSRRHFALLPENTFAFNRFNGEHTLGAIGHTLAAEMGWEEEQAFAHVRSLFLLLVSALVCLPANPPESDTPRPFLPRLGGTGGVGGEGR